MATAYSPVRVLKERADRIAEMIKRYERGEWVDPTFKIAMDKAREKNGIRFAVVMDDKVVQLEMEWEEIQAISEAKLAETLLKLMRATREPNTTRH